MIKLNNTLLETENWKTFNLNALAPLARFTLFEVCLQLFQSICTKFECVCTSSSVFQSDYIFLNTSRSLQASTFKQYFQSDFTFPRKLNFNLTHQFRPNCNCFMRLHLFHDNCNCSDLKTPPPYPIAIISTQLWLYFAGANTIIQTNTAYFLWQLA